MTLEQYDFKIGDYVKVIGGDYKGRKGLIIGIVLRGDKLRYCIKINNKLGIVAAANNLRRKYKKPVAATTY